MVFFHGRGDLRRSGGFYGVFSFSDTYEHRNTGNTIKAGSTGNPVGESSKSIAHIIKYNRTLYFCLILPLSSNLAP
jgi:hypothetical protein